jgi:hypothetical protein
MKDAQGREVGIRLTYLQWGEIIQFNLCFKGDEKTDHEVWPVHLCSLGSVQPCHQF